MKTIAGKPMLSHVLRRALSVRGVDEVVLATTDSDRDTPLTWLADDCGIPCVRGNEHDVLARFVQAATIFKADVVMRITGDCPLLAPDVCTQVLDEFINDNTDTDEDVCPIVEFVSNDTCSSGFPDGTDVEVMSARLLKLADKMAPTHAPWTHGDREHVTSWMRRTQPQRVIASDEDWRHVKLSVDCDADLERVRLVFGFLRDGDMSFAATMAAWQLACAD